MKIVEGHFPWRLLYLPLVIAAAGAMAYITVTDGWDRPVGLALYLFLAGFAGWWALLMVRSGVATNRNRPGAIHRKTEPVVFWVLVFLMLSMALVFLLVSLHTARP